MFAFGAVLGSGGVSVFILSLVFACSIFSLVFACDNCGILVDGSVLNWGRFLGGGGCFRAGVGETVGGLLVCALVWDFLNRLRCLIVIFCLSICRCCFRFVSGVGDCFEFSVGGC